jgi:hypothetical protein
MALDESLSMASVLKETIDGYNEYIDELKNDDVELVDSTYVTLVKYNSRAWVVFGNKPLKLVQKLDTSTYQPGGMTALYDGIGKAVSEVTPRVAPEDKVLVVVQTDGGENSSTEFSNAQIQNLISNRFVYLGADQDAWSKSQHIGFQQGSTVSYNSADTSGTYASLAGTTKKFRGAVAASMGNFSDLMADEDAEVEEAGSTKGATNPKKG